MLPDWVGCLPIGLLWIGLDRKITHWVGRQNLGCFKKIKSRPISCFFFAFIFSHVILICSSSKYHSKIMCSSVINKRDLSINLPSFMLVRCDDSSREWWGFGCYKGQDLNVQLYINSIILFKWLSWQSGLNISYTKKSLRVTQISQCGLDE